MRTWQSNAYFVLVYAEKLGAKSMLVFAMEGWRGKELATQCFLGFFCLPQSMQRNWQFDGRKFAAAFVSDSDRTWHPHANLLVHLVKGGMENIKTGIPWLAEINNDGGAVEHGTSVSFPACINLTVINMF